MNKNKKMEVSMTGAKRPVAKAKKAHSTKKANYK